MNGYLYPLLAITLFLVIFLLWRIGSKRHEIPCPSWLGWMVELDNPFTKTNRAKYIIRNSGIEPGMTVLDAGCGPGRLSIPTAKKVGPNGRVVAMDIQEGMLDRVREKITLQKIPNIDLIHGGLGRGLLEKNRFDRALLVTVIGEIPDKGKALREIYHSLKPGAILSITEVIFDPHFQTQKTVSQLITAAGFHQMETIGNKIAYTMNVKKPASKEI